MKYAVMFEPFGKFEYVCENDENNFWVTGSKQISWFI